MTTLQSVNPMSDTASPTPRSVDDIDWLLWQPTELATLMFIRNDDDLLLIRKKRGLGAGKVNAPGGRQEGAESIRQCAIRETQEELLVTPHNPQLRGRQRFHFVDGYRLTVFVYLSDDHSGVAQETAEAAPLWTPVDAIPYEEMWADDVLWIPKMLRGEVFDGRYIFDGDRMVDYRFKDEPDLALIDANDPGI